MIFEKKAPRLYLGRPAVIDGSTLAMALYSVDSRRVGQVLISVNVVAIYGGAVEVPPELMVKLKQLLSTEKLSVFKLKDAN